MTEFQPPVCVLLPVLNEIAHIGPLWRGIANAMGERPFNVCFVDDGSKDGTLDALHDLERRDSRVKVISRVKTQRGSQRGGALLTAMKWGLEHPEHRVFVEMDGDLSHRPEELTTGLAMIDGGECDIAIASKYLRGSDVTNRPVGRRLISVICNLAVRTLLSRNINDYSNGYRFYSRRAAEVVAASTIHYGSPIYLTEVMAIWLANGLRVAEFPTTYVGRNEGLSKLRKRDLVKAAVGVFEVAARYHGGFLSLQRLPADAGVTVSKSDAKSV